MPVASILAEAPEVRVRNRRVRLENRALLVMLLKQIWAYESHCGLRYANLTGSLLFGRPRSADHRVSAVPSRGLTAWETPVRHPLRS